MKGSTVSDAKKIAFDRPRSIRPIASITVLALAIIASAPRSALADEGGVSFWIRGFFGSLAAAPQQPGWSHVNLLSHQRICRSGHCPRTTVRDRQNLPQCHGKRERKPPSESRSGLAHANLHIRHAGFGGPAYCGCHWA